MNRRAKNIIFWTIVGILTFIFLTCFVFGCIRTIAGAGTKAYIAAGKFISAFGLSKSDFYNWSPYICVVIGSLLSFLFYKRYNTRIN